MQHVHQFIKTFYVSIFKLHIIKGSFLPDFIKILKILLQSLYLFLGHNSVIFMIESQMDFIAHLITKTVDNDFKTIEVK